MVHAGDRPCHGSVGGGHGCLAPTRARDRRCRERRGRHRTRGLAQLWISRATALRKLLVCLDGSEGSEEVLPWVRTVARHLGSNLLLLTAPEADSEVPRLDHYHVSVAAALRTIGLAAETQVTGSGAARTITDVAESEGCDLIMMATRGRGAPEDIDIEVGSVTDRVVQSAHCPVFAVTVLGFADVTSSARTSA